MLAYYDADGRVCTSCSIYKPWDAFHRQARGQNGRHAQCALCHRAANRARREANIEEYRRKDAESKRAARAANPDADRAYQKAYRAQNKEWVAEQNRKHYLKHTEKVKAGVRRYNAAHPTEAKAWQQNYRARRRSAGLLTGAMIRRVLQAKECFYCEKPFMLLRKDRQPTLDHVVPLSQHGSNEEWNLVACCRSCNSRKKHRNLAQWTPDIGRTRIAEKMATRLAALGVIGVDSS